MLALDLPEDRISTNVEILLTRASGSNDDTFRLEVIDRVAKLKLCEISIPLSEIPAFISTRPTKAELTLYPTSAKHCGKKVEVAHMDLFVGVDHDWSTNLADRIEVAAKDYELKNPGWQVDRYVNARRYDSKTGLYPTTARRWL